MNRILLLEDTLEIREMLKLKLESQQFRVDEAASIAEAGKKIELNSYDIFILDMMLPDGNSIKLFDRYSDRLKAKSIIITGNPSIPTVVEAIKKGAVNYLEKPVSSELLIAQVAKIMEINRLVEEHQNFKNEVVSNFTFDKIVCRSNQMERMIERAKILSRTDNIVLIQGETGTGKEVFAQAIHNHSLRNQEIFLPVNCASIPGELFESELFGFEKGAFSGATTSYRGRFLQANGGTLLLDEIGELPLHIQAKLLRVLDEQVIYRLKSEKGQKIDVRLIAASNKNLVNEVKLKNFRSDLFYRLKESMVVLPPLRERIEDILPLTRHYIGLFNTLYGKAIEGISKEVEYYFLNATWPGNVRELKNFIKSIIPFTINNTIEMDDLSYSAIKQEKTGEDRILTYEEYKKNYIIKVLQITDFNISRAAKLLSMSRPSLYRKIKEFNIKKEGPVSID